ncbi:tetratricopeptide repeat protein [Candidatus Dependentiae bacterium]|nr:tetratricopeptide repeat protein [Candidatus Dependentiae bacterium]MBU4387216.1 tetratricopeptide repeat protein [Candidatus Dependentiae bacterium]
MKNKNLFNFIQKHISAAILTITTFLFYYPSLKYPFQFDDLANITKKFAIRNDNPLTRFFCSRWIVDWLNRINYEMDRFNPFYYRLFNLFIHITAGILLFYLLLTLLNKLEKTSFFYKNSILIAFATSGLFLLHPVQTQTVSYIIQGRLEGLASMLILANLLILVNALLTNNKILKTALFILSAVISILSFGSKEIIVITPILLFLCDWFFISKSNWSDFKTRIFYHLGFAAFFYLFYFSKYMDFSFFTRAVSLKMVTANNRGNILTNHAQDVIKPLEFLISEFKVILHYLWIFIVPFGISVEYDWKLSTGFFSADSFFPFLVLFAIVIFIIYSIINKKNSLLVFGLSWFFITIAPRTTIIPSPELLCDYKTYLASIGWLFLLASALVYVAIFIASQIRNIKVQFLQFAQIAVLLIFLIPVGTATYNRNTVWRTAEEFWHDIVKKAPLKARGHNNYGVALSECGKVDKAIKHYQKAISLDRYYSDPLSNIAVAYSMKNEIDKAIEALNMALLINPNYPEAYNNIGTLYLSKKDYVKSEEFLNKAIELRPYYGKAYYNKGRLYMEKSDEQTAWTFFKKATEGDLDTPEGFFTLGQLSIRLQKYEDAAYAFEKIISLGVKEQAVQFNLANSYYMLKRFDEAEKIYASLVSENPVDGRYAYNLAETYLSKKEFEKALVVFQKVLSMPNAPGQAHLRAVACLESLNRTAEVDKYLEELLKAQAPDDFKQAIRNQKAQIELQRTIKSGNGSIKMGDLKNILAQAKPKDEKENKTNKKA